MLARELQHPVREIIYRTSGQTHGPITRLMSPSDLGEIVYNLIASGDLEKTSTDSRSDFDDVFDLEQARSRDFDLALDDVA